MTLKIEYIFLQNRQRVRMIRTETRYLILLKRSFVMTLFINIHIYRIRSEWNCKNFIRELINRMKKNYIALVDFPNIWLPIRDIQYNFYHTSKIKVKAAGFHAFYQISWRFVSEMCRQTARPANNWHNEAVNIQGDNTNVIYFAFVFIFE